MRPKAKSGHHLEIKSSSRNKATPARTKRRSALHAKQLALAAPVQKLEKESKFDVRIKRGVPAHEPSFSSRRRRTRVVAEPARSRSIQLAQALIHALVYAHPTAARKRDMRRLEIERINAASRQHGVPYGRFMAGLKAAGVEVDRKIWPTWPSRPAAFAAMVETSKASFSS